MNDLLNKCRDQINKITAGDIDNSMGAIKKRIRRTYILLGIFFLFQCYCLISWAQDDINNGWGIAMDVRPLARGLGSYKDDKFADGNNFISGTDGTLYWKPRTLTESILLNTFSQRSSPVDLFELIAFLLLALLFMAVISSGAKATYFSKNLTRKFILVVFVICMWRPVLELIKEPLGKQYVMYITHCKFIPVHRYGNAANGMTLYMLLSLLIIFPQKALELQKEAELTI